MRDLNRSRLRGGRRAKRLWQEAFDRAEEFDHGVPIETHMNNHTLRPLIERARRYHLHAIDGLYFGIALDLGLSIATVDRGLRAAAKSHPVKLFARRRSALRR